MAVPGSTEASADIQGMEHLVAIEARVSSAEADGLRARWEFGRELLKARDGKGRLPNGYLAAVVERTGASQREISYRIQFAERYPTKRELRKALQDCGSWWGVIEALPRSTRPLPISERPALPSGAYATIVADPPWDYSADKRVTWTERGVGDRLRLAHPYGAMTLDEIAALDVEGLAADDAHLYLWTTQRFLRSSFEVVEAWGFEPVKTLVWAKNPRGFHLGGTFQSTTEFVLFARRGKLAALRQVNRDWFNWERLQNQHSAKPTAFYELVETVSPAPRIDLFARREREGWDVWGDEVEAAAA